MLTYEIVVNGVAVYLDKRRIGLIKKESGGFRYYPKNHAVGGELFPTIEAVKRSLENE